MLRCRGKSYLDLLAQRAGDCASAPDAVVAPASVDGGRGGAGGVRRGGRRGGAVRRRDERRRRARGGARRVLARWSRWTSGGWTGMISVDPRSLTAVFEPGIRLPEADAALRAHGLALGHVPQSYEWATVGGCAATRSAGPVLDRPRADRRAGRGAGVRDARRGRWRRSTRPGTAAGPSLRQLVLGSEGAFGVITRVALRVRPLQAAVVRRLDRGLVPGGRGRAAAARAGRPGAGHRAALRRGGDAAQRRAGGDGRGRAASCWTGAACWSAAGRASLGRGAAARLLARGGARPLGSKPGRAWEASRFAGPHLRDDLLDRGVLVETLETATSWSNLEAPVRGGARRVWTGCTSAATSRTSIRPAPRCTSRSSAASRTTRSRSGAR